MRVRVLDLETTGFEPTCGVVEIGACDVREGPVLEEHSLRSQLVNPGVPIPPSASSAHHLVDEDVAGERSWSEVWPDFRDDELTAYAAHNAAFEQQFITDTGDVPWICTWKCALRAFPDAPGYGNGELRYWLKYENMSRTLAEPAHRAQPDAYVTAFLLVELLKHLTIEEMIDISSKPALMVRVSFGKHRGKKWADVDSGYLKWVVQQSDMDENTVFTARHHYNSRLKQPESPSYA